jgi:uncharacterized membrane protein YoaK (UPF0700 family)
MTTAVRSVLDDVRQTLFPRRGAQHGLLPPLLVGMTVITGLVDAFSYLVLGHVFVANMTGNVVFLGFALAGVGGFSVTTSVVAVGAFVIGALGGGLFRSHLGTQVGRQLGVATGIQLLLMAVALVLSAVAGGSVNGALRDGLVAILAAALGIQNATARGLAVPDLTTTVLTLTITGIAADAHAAGGSGARAGRRLISVGAMLGGAVAGGVLILRGQWTAALAVAVILMAVIFAATRLVPRWAPA